MADITFHYYLVSLSSQKALEIVQSLEQAAHNESLRLLVDADQIPEKLGEEIKDSTFYRMPKVRSINKWASKVMAVHSLKKAAIIGIKRVNDPDDLEKGEKAVELIGVVGLEAIKRNFSNCKEK
jgi:hypothetical protein